MAISSAAQKILDAAIQHFADKGFDAGSLKTIAESAGIKKATIYSHFKNKDELFLQSFKEAIETESAFVDTCFDSDNIAGENYLINVSSRYQESDCLKLLLRASFIPPAELRTQVQSGYGSFLERIIIRFREGLPDQIELEENVCINAYLGIIDSVHVELLYASPLAAETRREALWRVFLIALGRGLTRITE